MKLSIIMPSYNEEKTIKTIIKKIMDLPLDKELIIVDDFSKDQTRNILNKYYSKVSKIKLILQPKNMGKGMAIRTGLKNVTGDIIVIQDADLEYDPKDLVKLIKPIIDKKTNVVFGSRFLHKNKNQKQLFSFYMGNNLLTVLANLLYGTHITDEATCYKMFTKKIIKKINLRCERFEFCPEVFAKICKLHEKIIELPVAYYPRDIKEGKKIRLSDGFSAIWTLIKYKFID